MYAGTEVIERSVSVVGGKRRVVLYVDRHACAKVLNVMRSFRPKIQNMAAVLNVETGNMEVPIAIDREVRRSDGKSPAGVRSV
jgi:hypothetical protein